MKLRIRGDSIRIRVSQSELREYAEHGQVRDVIHFGAGSTLTYALESDATAVAPVVRYAHDRITIVLPVATVQRWARSDEVSVEGEQAVDGDTQLRILVEKDFACLQPRPHEDDADSFPNPQATAASCQ
jgi:Family of unknown function (DUF7009)